MWDLGLALIKTKEREEVGVGPRAGIDKTKEREEVGVGPRARIDKD